MRTGLWLAPYFGATNGLFIDFKVQPAAVRHTIEYPRRKVVTSCFTTMALGRLAIQMECHRINHDGQSRREGVVFGVLLFSQNPSPHNPPPKPPPQMAPREPPRPDVSRTRRPGARLRRGAPPPTPPIPLKQNHHSTGVFQPLVMGGWGGDAGFFLTYVHICCVHEIECLLTNGRRAGAGRRGGAFLRGGAVRVGAGFTPESPELGRGDLYRRAGSPDAVRLPRDRPGRQSQAHARAIRRPQYSACVR